MQGPIFIDRTRQLGALGPRFDYRMTEPIYGLFPGGALAVASWGLAPWRPWAASGMRATPWKTAVSSIRTPSRHYPHYLCHASTARDRANCRRGSNEKSFQISQSHFISADSKKVYCTDQSKFEPHTLFKDKVHESRRRHAGSPFRRHDIRTVLGSFRLPFHADARNRKRIGPNIGGLCMHDP